jgi:hypothetical protein
MKHILSYKIFENKFEYTEVEFVCYNSKMGSSTTKENQLKLYKELKKSTGLLPYMQDWSEGDDEQISLAVIILTKNQTVNYIDIIKKLAKENNIEIDIIDTVPERKIDEIMNGNLENLII